MNFREALSKDYEKIAPSEEKKRNILKRMKIEENSAVFTENSEFSRKKRHRIGEFAAAAAAFVLIVTGAVIAFSGKTPENVDNIGDGTVTNQEISEIETAKDDYSALYAALNKKTTTDNSFYRDFESSGGALTTVVAGTSNSDGKGGSENAYSQTNIQVENVDEADIIKTDGKYIYYLSDNRFWIVSAEGEDSALISETVLSDNYSGGAEMYLDEDRLYIIVRRESDFLNSRTGILTYDISDRTNPELINSVDQSGWYSQSRMKDGIVFLVSNLYYDTISGISEDEREKYVPVVSVNGNESFIPADRIYLPDNGANVNNLSIITSFDTTTLSCKSEMTLAENNGSVYMKDDYFVVTFTVYDQGSTELDDGTIRYDSSNSTKICLIDTEGGNLTLKAKASFKGEVIDQFAIDEYDGFFRFAATDTKNSYIVNANDDNIDDSVVDMPTLFTTVYEDTTEVTMYVESEETSVSERGGVTTTATSGAFTPSTTAYIPFEGNDDSDSSYVPGSAENPIAEEPIEDSNDEQPKTENHIYIFDSDLNLVSDLTDFGTDERIQSVRFDGNIGYVITFLRTDPLFSIDLSDPASPKILDEMEITGFSEYLHPFGEGRLLGIGIDGNEFGETSGMKLVMFDTSDKTNLRVMDSYSLPGMYSEVLNNHKSALINEDEGLIGFAGDYDGSFLLFRYSEEDGFTMLNIFKKAWESNVPDRAVYSGESIYICATDYNLGENYDFSKKIFDCYVYSLNDFSSQASVESEYEYTNKYFEE